jgi:hypothetical protein
MPGIGMIGHGRHRAQCSRLPATTALRGITPLFLAVLSGSQGRTADFPWEGGALTLGGMSVIATNAGGGA